MKRISNLILLLSLLAIFLPAKAQVFYKIEGNGLTKPSYLFGTHHLAPQDFLTKFKSLPEAEETAEAVVGEIDMTMNPIQLQMEMSRYMMAPEDSTLSKLLPPEEFAVLNEKFIPFAPMPGMDLNALDPLRPMVATTMVTLNLVQRSLPDFNPEAQLDASFQKDFKQKGKSVIALETPAQQAELLYCSTPISRQMETLKELLNDPEKAAAMAQRLNEAYMNQDLQAMYNLSKEEEEDPAFMLALLDRRNHDWMTRLPGIMAEQPSLIVVGALHLAGEEGLINLLEKEGFTITPMN